MQKTRRLDACLTCSDVKVAVECLVGVRLSRVMNLDVSEVSCSPHAVFWYSRGMERGDRISELSPRAKYRVSVLVLDL